MECAEIGIKRLEAIDTETLALIVNNYLFENDITNIINIHIDRTFSKVIGTLIYYK